MGSKDRMAGFAEHVATVAREGETVSRARVAMLLDPDSFVEIDARARSAGVTFGFEREPVDGDGVTAGYGTVDGRPVYVVAQDPDVYGGSIGRIHARKIAKTIRLAIQSRAPFIGMYDSGGARIEEGALALDGMAEVMSALQAAAADIPTIAMVLGPCAGGLAVAAAQSDLLLMGGPKAGLFMNGPAVVAASERKSADPQALGGAAVHTVETGLAAFAFATEAECSACVRTLLDYLPDSADAAVFPYDDRDDANRTDEALDHLAASMDTGYDMRTVLASVMDSGSLLEVSAAHATGLFVGFARLSGYRVGVVANIDPLLDAPMLAKATRFVRFCDAFSIPLITFTDVAGFAVGTAYEKSPMIRYAAEMTAAFADCLSPRLGIIVGQAYGTAYAAMNSKQTGADLVYAWPTADVGVVSADVAANIIYRKQIAASEHPMTARASFVARYADEVTTPHVAAALGLIDEIIQPAATRPRLASALDMLISAY